MADGKQEDRGGIETEDLTGSDLQRSQSGGDSGLFGGNRDQRQSGQAGRGGQQMGGGATASDFDQAGGSSGTGGDGNAQNQEKHQGQAGADQSRAHDPQQSRGERVDEDQGGGRNSDSLGSDQQQGTRDEFARDQQAHQDRGQSDAEAESEQSGR